MNEAETRAEQIDPALKAAGWGVVEGSKILREYPITPGRIEGHGRRAGGVEEVAAAPSLHRRALMNVPFPIPTGLHPSAQQPCCLPSEVLLTKEGQATLGHAPQRFPQPQRGCILPVSADGRYPVGVNQLAESRQLVTNCHRLKAGCRSVSQLVTNC